jgi:hypothetical protein
MWMIIVSCAYFNCTKKQVLLFILCDKGSQDIVFPRFLRYSNYSSKSWIVTLLKEENHIYLEALCMAKNTNMAMQFSMFWCKK